MTTQVCFSCAKCKEVADETNLFAYCQGYKRQQPHHWIADQWHGEMGDPNEPPWVFVVSELLGRPRIAKR